MKPRGVGLIFWIVILLMVLGAAYVRLAPSDVTRWHLPIEGAQDRDTSGSALRVLRGDMDAMMAVHGAMMAEPRTVVVAGDPKAGMVTYVTRSKIFGFPDHTTVELVDGTLKLFARLRFGHSDMGVNGRRMDRILDRAGLRG